MLYRSGKQIKDWQALMRHYTGKHGILEGFLREIINNGLQLPPNPKHVRRQQQKLAKQKAAREAREAKRMQARLAKMEKKSGKVLEEENAESQQIIESPPMVASETTVTSPPPQPHLSRADKSDWRSHCHPKPAAAAFVLRTNW